ncbi:hypothetical protein [Methanomethylovorans sp.]|uniref:hypothetical protein n=1 Tax=Methanomethylovorans sp. TaxID=2758717 RepID=UPI00345E3475
MTSNVNAKGTHEHCWNTYDIGKELGYVLIEGDIQFRRAVMENAAFKSMIICTYGYT